MSEDEPADLQADARVSVEKLDQLGQVVAVEHRRVRIDQMDVVGLHLQGLFDAKVVSAGIAAITIRDQEPATGQLTPQQLGAAITGIVVDDQHFEVG